MVGQGKGRKTKAALNSIATAAFIENSFFTHLQQQLERDASWVGIMHPLKYQSEFYIMWLVHTFLGPETVAERALKSPLLLYF